MELRAIQKRLVFVV